MFKYTLEGMGPGIFLSYLILNGGENMSENNHIGREFIKYTGLNVLGMIGLSCYILADTFFVSKAMGTNGLATWWHNV